MKQYRAFGTNCSVTANTPRQAAKLFFETFPARRKCNIIEGTVDGSFFTVSYGWKSLGEWPSSYDDVTKKTIETLPDTNN